MTPEEIAKFKEKLRISMDRLALTEAAYEEIQKKIVPLQKQVEKLKRDVDYYRLRVIKYKNILKL